MRRRVLTAVVLSVASSVSAAGQSVVVDHSAPNPFASEVAFASTSFPGQFPNPVGDDTYGTLIVVSGDFQHSDVRLVGQVAPIQRSVAAMASLLSEVGRPAANVKVSRQGAIASIDLDFAPYIHSSLGSSSSSIPIGRIVARLQQLDLPKPIGIAINHSKYVTTRFGGKEIEKMVALSVKDIPEDATVEESAERHWYGLAGLLLFAWALGACVVSFFYWALVSRSKWPKWMKAQRRPAIGPRSRHALSVYIVTFAAIQVVAQFAARFALGDAGNWIPAAVTPFVLPLACGIGGLMTLGLIVRGIRGAKASPAL